MGSHCVYKIFRKIKTVKYYILQYFTVLILRDMIYDIFVNCNWVDTRWQKYSTHLHTNNT
jgi:hypothetical protein